MEKENKRWYIMKHGISNRDYSLVSPDDPYEEKSLLEGGGEEEYNLFTKTPLDDYHVACMIGDYANDKDWDMFKIRFYDYTRNREDRIYLVCLDTKESAIPKIIEAFRFKE